MLGDRIAILSHGHLRCSGTSQFLKGRFGIGYMLTIERAVGCDPKAVTSLVQSHVDEAQAVTLNDERLSFRLPRTQLRVTRAPSTVPSH